MGGIKEVATKAGVSIATVSNVLNKSKYVSPELVKRVEKAVKELNYKVDPIASGMKSKKSKTIGVITQDICGVFYPYIMKGINSIADEKGYQVIMCDVDGSSHSSEIALGRERALFHKLLASRVDGIIFVSAITGEGQDEYFAELKKMARNKNGAIPMVSLERDLTMLGIDSVYFDSYNNVQKAVEHLAKCGCKKVGHIAGPVELQIANERRKGYEDYLKLHDMELDEEKMIAYGDYTHQSGYTAMKDLLENVPDIDGVFCSNDQMAIGALRYLKERNIDIPGQIKIIGYDDAFVSSVVEPPLSTIHIQKKTAGRRAATVLFERIEREGNDEMAVGIKLESRLIVRKSTKEDAKEDWDLNDW